MNRVLPHPLLSATLVLMWLVLTRFSLGHLVLGSLIAVIAGLAMSALQPARPRFRRPILGFRLAWIVMRDVLRSNAAVAWLILSGGRYGQRRSGFVRIPMELRDPSALAILAIIVTATPGTAWLEYDSADGTVLLHVFDLVDEAGWHDLIRNRYGALLMEIFE